MFISKQLKMTILVAVVAIIGVLAPSHVGAQSISKSQDDRKKECIQHKDGTKDCSPIFIEVGEPMSGVMASCSGYGCDGQDPYSAGCAVSYGVIDMRYIYNGYGQQVGYVQLWWSNTCQTNWARTVRTAPTEGTTLLGVAVYRDDNNNRAVDSSDKTYFEWAYEFTSFYSRMVYAPARLAMAEGTVGYFYSRTGWN